MYIIKNFIMIERTITPEQFNLAYELTAKETKTSLDLSKFGSELLRIFDGYLGEIMVADMLGLNKGKSTFEYDLISEKGKLLDVKTITCSFKPEINYLATVNSCDEANNKDEVHKQKSDYYIFTRILFDYSKGWVVGWIPCDEFFNLGTFVKKGTNLGKFSFVKADATVLEIYKLKQFKEKDIVTT